MSRSYRIRVSDSETRVIHAGDAVSTRLQILEILPPQDMSQLLADELRRRGFGDDGKLLRRDDVGVRVTIDPATATVTVQAESCDEVEIESTQEGLAYDDIGPAIRNVKAHLRQKAKDDIAERAKQEEQKLQQKTSEQLETGLLDLKREMDEAINRVTAEALKRKAAQIGQIKEIHEDPESGSLTIRIEV